MVHLRQIAGDLKHAAWYGVVVVAAGCLAVAVVAATPNHTGRATSTARHGALVIGGTPISKVRYGNRVMSLDEYDSAAVPAALAAGRTPHLMVDRSAVARGYLVSFDSRSGANAYLVRHGMGRIPRRRTLLAEGATGTHVQTPQSIRLGSASANLATCSLPNHHGALYDGTSCTGADLLIGYPDNEPNLGTYGWNDRASSIALGDCISDLHVWINSNYGGAEASFGGDDVYTTIPPENGHTFNNEISSFKSIKSGAC